MSTIIPDSIQRIFDSQRDNSIAVATTTYQERKVKLEQLESAIIAKQEAIIQATYEDLRKPRQEAILSEIVAVLSELRYTKKHLKRWLQPHKVPTGLTSLGTSSYIQYEAKGQVLLIAPWNYPFCLVVKPLISAIAAGCTVIIKPSEFTPATNRVLVDLVRNLFTPNEITIIEGEAETSQQLLALPFNHIFFTGSPQVGKIVMKAAAEHLASVTLELGGKSPLIIDETANLAKIVKQIVWAKYLNNGQTCIAPDYVFVHQSQYSQLLSLLQETITEMYSSDTLHNKDYGRIINHKQFDRLVALVQEATTMGAKIITGGQTNREEHFIAPTILVDVRVSMRIMQEEIFGPLLPIIPYEALQEVTSFIQKNPKPLALYLFSTNPAHHEYILRHTSSGNVMINDFLQHFANPELPFGGINNSGIGKSNGFYGFQQFCNAKGIMHRRLGSLAFLFPPYRTEGLQATIFKLLPRWS